jgi:hypothetical protein
VIFEIFACANCENQGNDQKRDGNGNGKGRKVFFREDLDEWENPLQDLESIIMGVLLPTKMNHDERRNARMNRNE